MYRFIVLFFLIFIVSSPVSATILDVEADTIKKVGDGMNVSGAIPIFMLV